MILGIGTDIVQISKYGREVVSPDPADYLRHHFALEEVEIVEARRTEDKLPLYAARWAAKEAFIKAISHPALFQEKLSVGVADYREIKVLCDLQERPYLEISGAMKKLAEDFGVTRTHVSMSHDGDYATAFVVLEGTS